MLLVIKMASAKPSSVPNRSSSVAGCGLVSPCPNAATSKITVSKIAKSDLLNNCFAPQVEIQQ
jgi:hypothetical protein